MTATVEIRRAADRAVTTTSWLKSRHSFSFGDHYDPDNTHHGLLLVNNDDQMEPASGFDPHPHRDMEIVTWVLRGALRHQDSAGNSGVIYPGLAQRMSAGTGILHSEMNDSATEPVHFVQMWVIPDATGITASYQQQEIDDELLRAGLVTIAYPGKTQRSPCITAAPRCTARGCGPALRSACPAHPSCICSSPTAASLWKVAASLPTGTRCGSPTLTPAA